MEEARREEKRSGRSDGRKTLVLLGEERGKEGKRLTG